MPTVAVTPACVITHTGHITIEDKTLSANYPLIGYYRGATTLNTIKEKDHVCLNEPIRQVVSMARVGHVLP